MLQTLEIWKMLAGIAIFLLGMNFLETGIKQLSARSFKIFIKKHTSNKIKAISIGAFASGVLQSSSIVNLMVLAFVGSGLVTMMGALAITLGSNLGTTSTSWLIASLGFNFDIDSFSLPIAGVAGLVMLMTREEKKIHQWSKVAFGFGFLFVGLNYIKLAVESSIKAFDVSSLNEHPLIIFVLAGFLITSLVQSSTVTVALVLSALNAKALDLFHATAMVIGAEVGTTIKLLLVSIRGPKVKKVVALGNFLFNVIVAIIIFILLSPVNWLIGTALGIKDELFALVFFQSLLNLTSIILFYPFLEKLTLFLEKRFKEDDDSMYINNVRMSDKELILVALEKETRYLINHVLSFTAKAFEIKDKLKEGDLNKSYSEGTILEKYEYIKRLHGEIHAFYSRSQNASLPQEDVKRSGQLISAVRNSMYAAKNIKDALHDIEQTKNSSNDVKYRFYLDSREKISVFINQAESLLSDTKQHVGIEKIMDLFQTIQRSYTESLQHLYKENMSTHVNDTEISTIINFNRELVTAFKSITFALKDFLLSEKDAEHFEELPGFIR